jgi:hypothetical protein
MLTLITRPLWAILIAAARIIQCDQAGHPGARWHDGVRSCDCGRKWPA